MANKPEDTQSIPLSDPRFQAMLAALDDSEGTATLSSFNEVMLLVDGMVTRFVIADKQEYMIGRFRQPADNQIDLNPFGALHHGVSRIHAKFVINNDRLYIVDLGSSNGTYVHRTRLHPQEPALINTGDEILLGRMRIQVIFQ